MSIEKIHSEYIPICDSCGVALSGELDFYEAVAAKKVAGWKSKKLDGEWQDVCEDCQKL